MQRKELDIDAKEELNHVDTVRTIDPALVGIAEELVWAQELSEEEFAHEQKLFLRKVSLSRTR